MFSYAMFPLSCDSLRTPRLANRSLSWNFFKSVTFGYDVLRSATFGYDVLRSATIRCDRLRLCHDVSSSGATIIPSWS